MVKRILWGQDRMPFPPLIMFFRAMSAVMVSLSSKAIGNQSQLIYSLQPQFYILSPHKVLQFQCVICQEMYVMYVHGAGLTRLQVQNIEF